MKKRIVPMLMTSLLLATAGCLRPAKPYLDKGNVLSYSGFVAHQANTTARYGLMNLLPPGTLTYRIGLDGKPVYLYADPIGCGCVYMGDQDAYNKLNKLPPGQASGLNTNMTRMVAENNRDSAQWDWTIWSPAADPDNNQPKHMIGNYW